MDTTERHVIDDLFGKLRQVESETGPRDHDAESHIRGHVARQPAAPYYMAQTILIQEQALAAAQVRIQEMEHELKARPAGSGFFAGLFSGSTPTAGRPSHAAVGDPRVAAYVSPDQAARPNQAGGGTGFLAGAMQTAVGVAGGMMLVNALGSMFGADEAAAAEPGFDDTSEDVDFGADDGDFGSFDDF